MKHDLIILEYLGSFDTYFIIFRNVEIFDFKEQNFVKKSFQSRFKNTLFIKMRTWNKLIIQHTCVEVVKVLW